MKFEFNDSSQTNKTKILSPDLAINNVEFVLNDFNQYRDFITLIINHSPNL